MTLCGGGVCVTVWFQCVAFVPCRVTFCANVVDIVPGVSPQEHHVFSSCGLTDQQLVCCELALAATCPVSCGSRVLLQLIAQHH